MACHMPISLQLVWLGGRDVRRSFGEHVMAQQPSWPRLIGSGLIAGAVINLCEWGVHAVWLDDGWREAFAALGKSPTGWSTFIPANFWVGILAVWGYRWLSEVYGSGLRTAVRTALIIWVIFWVIPTGAMQPLALFPNRLMAWTVLVGLFDGGLAALLGAWFYDGMRENPKTVSRALPAQQG